MCRFAYTYYRMKERDTTRRPTLEEQNYGKERYEEGYTRGYDKCFSDIRKNKMKKEFRQFQRFCEYCDYLEDILFNHRKR